MIVEIKLPPIYDTSHWKVIPDYAVVDPPPRLVLTKVTEGTKYIDPTFIKYFADLLQDKIRRGCFHFFRKALSALDQAKHFCNTIRPYITTKDILVLDVEEGGETAAQLKTWCDYVRSQFPNNLLLIYSRKNILDAIPTFLGGSIDIKWLIQKAAPYLPALILKRLDYLFAKMAARHSVLNAIQMTMAEREYFKKIGTWPAGYPFNPNIYSTIPSFYVPDQNRWGPPWLWQYSDKAFVTGISNEVDVNLALPRLITWLISTDPATEPDPDDDPIVVDPTEPETEPQLYDAVVIADQRRTIRSYPKVELATATGIYVLKGNRFQGRIWVGNGYVWLKIDAPQYPDLHKRWVAVRSQDGLSKFITLTKAAVTPVSIYQLRKWGDEVLVKEAGLSVDIVGTTNFQAIGLYNRITEWGGVSNFLTIPRTDIDRLIALQVEDDYEDKIEDWRSQKMNWLCKEQGTIYFTGDGMPGWKTAANIKWGTIGIGHNRVAVEGVEEMLVSTRGETIKRWRQMARLAGFRKTDWGRPLKDLLDNGLVHQCYCAYAGDKLGDSPKGIVYSPFWSPRDWDFTGTEQPTAFYIPLTWLLPV